MNVRPIHIWQADEFVKQHHRHNGKAGNGKFAIGCYNEGVLVGVAIAGRPRCRHYDDGITLEIYRTCTDGFKCSISFLIGRVKRIGQLMGYERFYTYTLQSESGVSLRAVGAVIVKDVKHKRDWNDYKKVKRKKNSISRQLKFLWEI